MVVARRNPPPRNQHRHAALPATIFFRSRSTSSRAYIRYEFIGCLRAGNFPDSSHLRRVGTLTPRSLAASAIVMRSAGSGSRRRATGEPYPTLITVAMWY